MPQPEQTSHPKIDTHFLRMDPYHLSTPKARELVTAELRAIGLNSVAGPTAPLVLKHGKAEIRTTYQALVTSAREFGTVHLFQSERDRTDAVFGGTHAIGSPNWQFRWDLKWAGYTKILAGPGWFEPALQSLTADILFFRKETCAHSDEDACVLSLRYFRSYLGTCISIAEAFMNRYIAVARHHDFVSQEFTELASTRDLTKRFKLWLEVFDNSTSNRRDFFASSEWSQFQEIRDYRNKVVHAVDPIAGYEMREVQRYLNNVRVGVGGLMLRMRNLRGEQTLGFIERLRTAPLVHFRRITFKADGNHKVKEVL
jgi:hypothetical protein